MDSTFEFCALEYECRHYLNLSDWRIDEELGLIHPVKTLIACPIPVLPTAVITNADTGSERVELQFWKFGRWHRILADKETISSASKIVSLSAYGLEVTSNNARILVNALSEILVTGARFIPHHTGKTALGWEGREFLPYSKNYVFDGEENYRYLYDSVAEKGDFEEWKKKMAMLREDKIFRILLAASFAAPLVEVVGENPFIVHLWGTTGFGKTVSLMCAMSVWGNPAVGRLTRTLNMTTNSMLQTAAFLNSIPFAADEMQTIKRQNVDYDTLIMQLTEGINRGRMKYDKMNDTASWRNAFLFTGEEPCLNQCSGGGAKNRVIEVHCTEKIIQDGNSTANFVRENYGHAGREFVTRLDFDKTRQYYKSVCADIIATCDTTEKQAGAAALILVADWLSTELFWPDDERVLTIDDIEPFLAGAKEVDASERAYQFIRDTIAEYSRNFTADCVDRWGTIEEDGRVFFNNTVLQRVLSNAGFDFNAVKTAWAERGYLEKGKDGRFRQLKKISNQCCSCSVLVSNTER